MSEFKQQIVYKAGERPLIEVLVDGRWLPGELRMWLQHEDDSWTAQVKYSDEESYTFIETVPADRVRKDEQ